MDAREFEEDQVAGRLKEDVVRVARGRWADGVGPAWSPSLASLFPAWSRSLAPLFPARSPSLAPLFPAWSRSLAPLFPAAGAEGQAAEVSGKGGE